MQYKRISSTLLPLGVQDRQGGGRLAGGRGGSPESGDVTIKATRDVITARMGDVIITRRGDVTIVRRGDVIVVKKGDVTMEGTGDVAGRAHVTDRRSTRAIVMVRERSVGRRRGRGRRI